MPPCSLVRAVESNKDRAWLKYSIRKSYKRRESTVEDKAYRSTLQRVQSQRISIQAAELSRAHHYALECVHIKIMSMQAEESPRSHHEALENFTIQN